MSTAPTPPRQHRYRRRADMPLLGGIRPPIALLLVLLLAVAAITALAVGGLRVDDTPQAVRESHQYAAEDTALSLRAGLRENTTDLLRSAARYDRAPAEPAEVLTALGRAYRKWRGTVIVRPDTGRLLAARGETVPLAGLDLGRITDTAPAPLLVPSAGGTRLLTFALVDTAHDGRALLVASDNLRLPALATRDGQTIQVLDTTGTVLDATGADLPDEAARQLVATARGRVTGPTADPAAAPGETVSGSLAGGADPRGMRRVAGYAAVAGADPRDPATALGLTVVSTGTVDGKAAGLRHPALGLGAAGALLALALLLAWFLRRTLQRPLLRLFLEARRLTRGELDRPVRGPRRGEAGRIGRALEELRRQLLDPARPPTAPAPGRRRPGAALPLGLAAAVVLGWSAPLLLLGGNDGEVRVPTQVVAGQRDRTDNAADRLRQALNEGYADLRALAPGLATASVGGAQTLLRTALARHERYRALYVLGAGGEVLARAGEEPHRTGPGALGPGGVLLLNSSGKEPRIAARTPLAVPAAEASDATEAADGSAGEAGGAPAAGPVLVGEFRTDFLGGLLDRPGLGRVWLLDDRHRVLAANEAYASFGELPEGRARTVLAAATGTSGTGTSTTGTSGTAPGRAAADVVRTGGDPVLLAAAPLGGRGAVARLGWSVVTVHPVSWLHLDQNRADRRAVLAGMLGLAAAALCLGWLYVAVGVPLRRLTASAEALAAGDRRTVLYPVHHDEVGAVARSLELIRQDLERADRERAGWERADRERAGWERADRERAGREQAGRERAAHHAPAATAP
ncbi:HAMP domain-containing protein [Kitasatospora sp. NPDC097605]|uniref:HAMP domain-containing protein n=1 Tax=Kitasatospora sp. NPDC097605 TaxID=3157226 RepID=UPI0033178B92